MIYIYIYICFIYIYIYIYIYYIYIYIYIYILCIYIYIYIAFPVSAFHGASSWKTTPVPGCPRASPTFLIQPTPSTTCTYLGWVRTSLAGSSVSMPQVTGSGDHLQRKCSLWTCVLECSCQPLQCAIQPSFELIE